jgi:hypothetical protein
VVKVVVNPVANSDDLFVWTEVAKFFRRQTHQFIGLARSARIKMAGNIGRQLDQKNFGWSPGVTFDLVMNFQSARGSGTFS